MLDDFVPKPFRCEVAHLDGTAVASPEGDLDMSTASELDTALQHARGTGARRIVVDLRGLEFMDSTGLSVLSRWNNASRREGFELTLIAGDERIHRLFTLTGLHDYFTFVTG